VRRISQRALLLEAHHGPRSIATESRQVSRQPCDTNCDRKLRQAVTPDCDRSPGGRP
jgi:hypothetical protein